VRRRELTGRLAARDQLIAWFHSERRQNSPEVQFQLRVIRCNDAEHLGDSFQNGVSRSCQGLRQGPKQDRARERSVTRTPARIFGGGLPVLSAKSPLRILVILI
jgi:hypothetical protein